MQKRLMPLMLMFSAFTGIHAQDECRVPHELIIAVNNNAMGSYTENPLSVNPYYDSVFALYNVYEFESLIKDSTLLEDTLITKQFLLKCNGCDEALLKEVLESEPNEPKVAKNIYFNLIGFPLSGDSCETVNISPDHNAEQGKIYYAEGYLYYSSALPSNFTLLIYNALGQRVRTLHTNHHNSSWNLQDLPAGIYSVYSPFKIIKFLKQ